MRKYQLTKISVAIILVLGIISCSNKSTNEKKSSASDAEKKYYDHPGVGPIKELVLEKNIDPEMAADGEKQFQYYCITCHVITDERRIGPGLSGITKRRRPEWIMNQMLNPMGMVKEDSLSRELFQIYQVQMTDMELTKGQARAILEYFRSINP